jgi:competence protein ComEC
MLKYNNKRKGCIDMRKKIEKELKRANKSLLVFLVIFFMITTCCFAYLWLSEYPSPLHKDETSPTDSSLTKNSDGSYTKNLISSSCNNNIEVYYIDLKNDQNETKIGDSTYIKCGDIDILIDAGVKNVGSNTVVPFLKEKVTDKKLELVIATHTDSDHIGGFVGLSSKEGVLSIDGFTYDYILESGYVAESGTYNDFMNAANATNAKICTPFKAMNGTDECAKSFKIGNASLDILETSFYNDSSASANDRSVVTLLTHNEVTFLFPGDLEDDEYFASTVNYNIDIFKASHHGASSANSQEILTALNPDVIILSTDGDNSYDIPQQESLNRMYSVTDKIYATFTTGTIKIVSNGSTYDITADNLELFQNTGWFEENRTYSGS